ncbi:MAG: hypothetical protein E6Q97_20800 [Desulfurellales bacterium]|nr:MAG: hypothetical protein E6Q97_20800 [Desulfurellales bacterium]
MGNENLRIRITRRRKPQNCDEMVKMGLYGLKTQSGVWLTKVGIPSGSTGFARWLLSKNATPLECVIRARARLPMAIRWGHYIKVQIVEITSDEPSYDAAMERNFLRLLSYTNVYLNALESTVRILGKELPYGYPAFFSVFPYGSEETIESAQVKPYIGYLNDEANHGTDMKIARVMLEGCMQNGMSARRHSSQWISLEQGLAETFNLDPGDPHGL